MAFTSFSFCIFIFVILILYWNSKDKRIQNIILLLGSYLFYGFIHPWFCILLASSTVVDYFCGLAMKRYPDKKKRFLIISLCSNLGMLGFFKYFNFFIENVDALLILAGLGSSEISLKIFLPVGISFYTFQTLSYTIDIYKGQLKPTKNFIDFALFVSFFPQLVAGPIERAQRFLPQIQNQRNWDTDRFFSAIPLMTWGFFKKLVVADNLSIYANKVYLLESPSPILLFAGTLAFTVQIFADFSAYTDIARGSARLIGFDLIKNFNAPYLAVNPSDFWRRWHISFSTWIRDYLYIPLGGSRVNTLAKYIFVVTCTMGLSGLWHGASWNFVLWGFFHAAILIVYKRLGKAGRWRPANKVNHCLSVLIMFLLTVFGWGLFRTHSVTWFFCRMFSSPFGLENESLLPASVIFAFVTLYSIPLVLFIQRKRLIGESKFRLSIASCLLVFLICIFGRDGSSDFIYFQF